MENIVRTQLLQDERVIKEIERYKWLESEKVGHDIGFESAAESWLNLYGDAWNSQPHQPEIVVSILRNDRPRKKKLKAVAA